MKVKNLLAALCCVIFLTGCGNKSGEKGSSSEYSVSSSSDISAVETGERSTGMTETGPNSSSLYSTELEDVKNTIPDRGDSAYRWRRGSVGDK